MVGFGGPAAPSVLRHSTAAKLFSVLAAPCSKTRRGELVLSPGLRRGGCEARLRPRGARLELRSVSPHRVEDARQLARQCYDRDPRAAAGGDPRAPLVQRRVGRTPPPQDRPRSLDQHVAGSAGPRLRDVPALLPLPRTALRWHQPQVGPRLLRAREAA